MICVKSDARANMILYHEYEVIVDNTGMTSDLDTIYEHLWLQCDCAANM